MFLGGLLVGVPAGCGGCLKLLFGVQEPARGKPKLVALQAKRKINAEG